MILGVWKQQIIKIIQKAPQVIRMSMGENNVRYISRINASLIQTIDQFASTGHELRTGTDIEKHTTRFMLPQ